MAKAEIAHGTRGSADVEGIARRHEDDDEAIEFGAEKQGMDILVWFQIIGGIFDDPVKALAKAGI